MPLKQKPDADRLFRELAGRYAELEGHALRQELGSRVTPVFPPELDRRIRRSTRGGSVRRLSLGLSCAAACLLAVLALPGVFQKPGPVSPASIPVSYTHLDVYKRQGQTDKSAAAACQP